MRYLILAILFLFAADAQAGPPVRGSGVLIVNNNNNNVQRQAQANVGVRARRPVLRFLFPRAAARRDAIFGPPVDRFGRVR